jgi:hypothetical protein
LTACNGETFSQSTAGMVEKSLAKICNQLHPYQLARLILTNKQMSPKTHLMCLIPCLLSRKMAVRRKIQFSERIMIKKLSFFSCLCLLGFVASANADTLHGFCWGGTPTCTDNGRDTPTSTDPPRFGFTASSGPSTGTFFVDFLVPDSNTGFPSLTVDVTKGGSGNNQTFSGTATLFSATAWKSGQLDSYLGISASPANPIGAYTIPSGSDGFLVYQANLGTNTLASPSSPGIDTLLSLTSGLPQGTYILGFLDIDGSFSATANSGAILETGTPTTTVTTTPSVPEPASLLLVSTGILGAVTGVRRRFAR